MGGVKIPVESALQWGILVILAIQFYLWIHLHELAPRLRDDDPGWDVAWIGVYRSLPARAFFLFSAAGMPFLAVLLLGNLVLKNNGQTGLTLYIVALVSTLSLSGLVFRALPLRVNPPRGKRGHATAKAHPSGQGS
jgi:hypothetical protein